MNESSPLSLKHLFFSFLSLPLLFLVPFWCAPSVIWLRRREAIENLVERVFMVDSVVRWLSQRRMLIRQPRLRLIWLAAVTPSSCSQSALRLFPPLQCSTAAFLSFCILFPVVFFSFYIQHPLLFCPLSFHRYYYGHYFMNDRRYTQCQQ